MVGKGRVEISAQKTSDGSEVSRAFIVNGDRPTRTLLRFLLERLGCRVFESRYRHNGHNLVLPAREMAILLIVADDDANDALGSLHEARRLGCHAPAVLLSRHTGLDLRRRAFELGVRDVIKLPAAPADLEAHFRTLLRRDACTMEPHCRGTVHAGSWVLRCDSRTVANGLGWSVRLGPREASLLRALMLSPGRVVSRAALTEQIWGDSSVGGAAALDMLMHRLRGRIARSGGAHGNLRTVPYRGYLFDARATERQPRCTDDTRRPTVLIIHGDPQTGATISADVHLAGHDVLHAVGHEGLILARKETPAVIVLDTTASTTDYDSGMLWQRLRADAQTADIPVIAIAERSKLRDCARQIEADDYLGSPVNLDELILRVGRLSRPSGGATLFGWSPDVCAVEMLGK